MLSGRAGNELERRAVHAVAQPGRPGPVVEDVAEVSAAAPAVHFGAQHAERAVAALGHSVRQRLPEARPAGAAVELGSRREQLELAAGADEPAGPVLVVQRAREWAF